MSKSKYKIRAKVWIYKGHQSGSSNASSMRGAWYFITIPKKQSTEIKKNYGDEARGWGSVPVKVTVGKTSWTTSIFPDKQMGVYILPLKAVVRKKEGISDEHTVVFMLEIKL
jgi:hypothetical protein